ncbi:hypothetical protein HOLleu_18448 [Holothuria leucospilota]|uniref:Transposon Ty3-I Gag-Pol polyprotein n=1 Tax=Holothuria leucospilota TaxID=206669 RepID=A0A9Q1C3K3_HOLLE|nr:hypothetical protein HOLleu_18448 [Holothuria leucospilota]
MEKYNSVFAKSPTDLGRTSVIQHEIDTGDARPIRQAPRRPPKAFEHEEEKVIREQLDAGVIRESKSPWASPLVFVRKKDGSTRPCVDYRKLNDVTRKDAYPLPRIDDCLDGMAGAKLFSTIDLQSGYWQIEVKESDRPKTAIITRSGLYEYQTLPFGLCNAPSSFQRCMELVLRGLQWKVLLVYLDDIIVFSNNFDRHIENLDEVLGRLMEAGLKLKPSKCEFFKPEVSFLGHVVSADGIKTDPKKVEAVQNWAVPQNVTDVRSFIGFCSYYRRFIRNFASIASPLHRLLEAGRAFLWDSECQQAFDTLKSCLVGDTVMSYPNNDDNFILDTDASDKGIGATLSQMQWNEHRQCKEERPIAHAKRRYCTTKRELLAVVVFVNYFRHYLLGRKFVIRTDHSALRWLMSFKEPTDQTARWIEILSQFNFDIEHRAGKRHSNADSLSRLPYCDPDTCDHYDGVTILSELPCGGCDKCTKKHESWSDFAKIDDVIPLAARKVGHVETQPDLRNNSTAVGKLFINQDVSISEKVFEEQYMSVPRSLATYLICIVWPIIAWICNFVAFALRSVKRIGECLNPLYREGWWNPLGEGSAVVRYLIKGVVTRSKSKHGRATEAKDETLPGNSNSREAAQTSHVDEGTNFDSRFSVFTRDELAEGQANDPDLKLVRQWLADSRDRPKRENIRADSLSPSVRNLWLLWDQLFLKGGILCKRWEEPKKNASHVQIVVPRVVQSKILRAAHNSISSAHLGINKTLKKVQRDYYWYKMKDDVKNWIRKCKTCGARKRPNRTPRAPLKVFSVGSPMDRVAVDILGPFPVSARGNKYVLVIGDVFTRWIEAYAIPDQTAAVVADKIVYEFFSRFGLPLALHSDQGKTFESKIIKEICDLLEIQKTRSSPYHPSSNGMIERFNQTLVNMIASYVDRKQEKWDIHLPLLTAAYRSCDHDGTGYSPNALMLGRETHTPLSLLLGKTEGSTGTDSDNYGEYAYNLKENFSIAYDIAREKLEKTGNRQKRDYDVKIAHNNYEVGDLVYYLDETKSKGLSPKLNANKWVGPCVVLRKFSDLLFELQKNAKARPKILHHDRLKPFVSDEVPDEVRRLQSKVRKTDPVCE